MNLSRRKFLVQAASTSVLLVRPTFARIQVQPDVVVHTSTGSLSGQTVGNVRVFRGVPFAEPPVGDLRFRPPVPVKPRKGERDATHFAPPSMQSSQAGASQSEDCLYLNIWVPQGKGPFPVYVWIHGGGFTNGNPAEPVFSGDSFAHEGIVQVNIAYRLGAFGFLDVSPLLGPTYEGSANNALRDAICALSWIKENIAAFGGDPNHVTIGGESAGAKLVGTLLGTPSAQPLFQQAISESGGAERVATASQAAEVARGFGEEWRHTSGGADLRTAPALSILRAQEQFLAKWPQRYPFRPEVDGALLPRLPIESIAAGSARGKQLLLGTNREESALFLGPHPSTGATSKDVAAMPLDSFLAIYHRYAELYPEMPEEQRRIRSLTAEEYWAPSVRVVDALIQGGGQAWVYMLTFSEGSGRLKGYAYHSLDLPLAFDKPNASLVNSGAETALAQQMHSAWSAFLHGKAPAAPGLPVWHAYNLKDRPTMMLDAPSTVQQHPYQTELDLWRQGTNPTR